MLGSRDCRTNCSIVIFSDTRQFILSAQLRTHYLSIIICSLHFLDNAEFFNFNKYAAMSHDVERRIWSSIQYNGVFLTFRKI